LPGFLSTVQSYIKVILAAGRIQEERDAQTKQIEYLERYMIASLRAHVIVNTIKSCNLLFKHLTDTPLFREDIEAVNGLHVPCQNEEDFLVKLGGLKTLFEVDLDPIRLKLKDFKKDWKLLKLVEQWFCENHLAYDKNMFQTWRDIIDLRDASFPYHPTDTRIVGLLRSFGHSFPVQYAKLYDSILDKFLESLNLLQIALNATVYKTKPEEK